jgi:hypothetical protein
MIDREIASAVLFCGIRASKSGEFLNVFVRLAIA